jgi:hypothetical protein
VIFKFLKRILKNYRINHSVKQEVYDARIRINCIDLRTHELHGLIVTLVSKINDLRSELTTQKISILNLQQDLEKLKNDFEFWSSEE